MQPFEMKRLRQASNMTQSDLADAIGMSREMIGAMERDRSPIELRTALAVQHVCEHKPAAKRDISTILRHVRDTLQAILKGDPDFDDGQELAAAEADWVGAGGGEFGRHLIMAARAIHMKLMFTKASDINRALLLHEMGALESAWFRAGASVYATSETFAPIDGDDD